MIKKLLLSFSVAAFGVVAVPTAATFAYEDPNDPYASSSTSEPAPSPAAYDEDMERAVDESNAEFGPCLSAGGSAADCDRAVRDYRDALYRHYVNLRNGVVTEKPVFRQPAPAPQESTSSSGGWGPNCIG